MSVSPVLLLQLKEVNLVKPETSRLVSWFELTFKEVRLVKFEISRLVVVSLLEEHCREVKAVNPVVFKLVSALLGQYKVVNFDNPEASKDVRNGLL
jgi:hypothetical protein